MRSFPAEPLAPTHRQGPGSSNGPGVEMDDAAKAEQIDPNPCLMDKIFPAHHSVHLVLNT